MQSPIFCCIKFDIAISSAVQWPTFALGFRWRYYNDLKRNCSHHITKHHQKHLEAGSFLAIYEAATPATHTWYCSLFKLLAPQQLTKARSRAMHFMVIIINGTSIMRAHYRSIFDLKYEKAVHTFTICSPL